MGKRVFMFSDFGGELIGRKLNENLKRCYKSNSSGRSQIVLNLKMLLAEGAPLRVYRLDIKSFYESFDSKHVISAVNKLHLLSFQSKELIGDLLKCHLPLGGSGVPRGLAISATLSDFLMSSFDEVIRGKRDVFYYSRYVDDIIVVTSAREDDALFVRNLERALPVGLRLNRSKKQIETAPGKVNPYKNNASPPRVFKFDYLGYEFSVYEPNKDPKKKSPGDQFRDVKVDIAEKKIIRFKTRISRSMLDYGKTADFELLVDRIKFLTKNFSVYNFKAGGKKVAGIFHSYPLVTEDALGLRLLDNYLKNAILSKNGRLNKSSSINLSGSERRILLSQSFVKGHAEKSFVHFSGVRLKEIQLCWKN